MRKILIIKTGNCETFDTHSGEVSLGDVFRTTALLNLFKCDNVTWITSKESYQLLKGNKFISNLIFSNNISTTVFHEYDILINLEKNYFYCHLASEIIATVKFGFYDTNGKMFNNCSYTDLSGHFLEKLFKIVGECWNEKCSYILPHTFTPMSEIYDYGLNWKIGSKWPTKSWDISKWRSLSNLLSSKFHVTWQEGLNSLDNYMEWISKCRTVITTDSLGLHLAIAMRKNIIALFGPTCSEDIYIRNSGTKIISQKNCSLMPCLQSICKEEADCMLLITPSEVYKEALKYHDEK